MYGNHSVRLKEIKKYAHVDYKPKMTLNYHIFDE